MPTMIIAEVVRHLEEIAPPETAEAWDNVGLLVGDAATSLSALLVCLEVTDAVIAEAEEEGAGLVVAHHPLIFRALAAIATDRPLGRLLQRLLCEGIAVYAAHTNLDAAPRVGTAAALGRLLGLRGSRPLLGEEPGLGLLGEVAEATTVRALAERVRALLEPARLTVVGDPAGAVRTVALMPGSGGDAVSPAADAGADVLICGDLGHHDALEARALGLTVIDAGHHATERPVVASLADELRRRLGPDVRVIESQVNTDPFAGGAE